MIWPTIVRRTADRFCRSRAMPEVPRRAGSRQPDCNRSPAAAACRAAPPTLSTPDIAVAAPGSFGWPLAWRRQAHRPGIGFGAPRSPTDVHQRALLPPGGFGIMAGREMCTADPDQIVECERVLRRELERNLEALDGGFGIASIGIDPTAAAPRPRRSAVKGERLPNDHICGIEFIEQCQGVANDGKHSCVAAKRPRPSAPVRRYARVPAAARR